MLSQVRTAVVPPPIAPPPRTGPPPSPAPDVFQQPPHLPLPPHPQLLSAHPINLHHFSPPKLNGIWHCDVPCSGTTDIMAGGSSGWSDAEKIQLLVEILKDCEAAPNWRNIKIPAGRTPLQAQHVFASLTASPSSSPAPDSVHVPPPQEPAQATSAAVPPKRPAESALSPDSPAPPVKRKRGRPSKADIALREQAQAGGANWAPQMYTPEAGGRAGITLGSGSAAGTPIVRKKRGRPSKAEMEARRERERQMVEAQMRAKAVRAEAGAGGGRVGGGSGVARSAATAAGETKESTGMETADSAGESDDAEE